MYIIKKVNENEINEKIWDNIESVKMDNFPWDTTGYKPEASAKVFYTENELRVQLTGTEKKIRIEEKIFNNPVWEDSCVEFFFMPDPENDNRYFNFETNACGNLVLQVDNKPPVRHYMNYVNPSYFEIKADVNDSNIEEYNDFKPWRVEYKIPFEFIKVFFKNFDPKPGYKMRGNFTKCGDKTETPHWGTWAKIETEEPAYHVPQYFNEIIFE